MPMVNMSMISSYLIRNDILFDDDGGLLVSSWDIAGADNHRASTVIHLVGRDDDILRIMGASSITFPQSRWGETMLMCNSWNRENRWPKAYLDTDGEHSGKAWVEFYVPLFGNVDQSLVDLVLAEGIRATLTFWNWAFEEHNLA